MSSTEDHRQTGSALAILRVTLGIVILVTWLDNLQKGLYTADGLTGFFNWLFDAENGNASTLAFYHSFLQAVVVPVAGPFALAQMVGELVLGLMLLLGLFTRISGIAAMLFFFNLFLAYFGGHEWIWVYVLLFVSSLTVALSRAGRFWGLEARLQVRSGGSNV